MINVCASCIRSRLFAVLLVAPGFERLCRGFHREADLEDLLERREVIVVRIIDALAKSRLQSDLKLD
jgi:hypothetical protein